MVDMAKLTVSIQRHEGLRLKPYLDSMGNWTIGFGRCLSTKGISNAEATYLLTDDINDALIACESEPWWPIIATDNVRANVLVELCYNLGISKLRTFKIALAALEVGDFDACADQFMNSLWAKEVKGRAVELTAMLRSGADISPAIA